MEKKSEQQEPNSTDSPPHPPPPQMDAMSALERFGTGVDGFRAWLLKSWRIGMLMVKGSYLIGERRRLFVKLGETVYYKIAKGEIQSVDLDPTVQQLDRLTKKIEIEEILIRSIRFGTKVSRSPENATQSDSKSSDSSKTQGTGT